MGRIGIAGVDTRALTSWCGARAAERSRSRTAKGEFDLDKLQKRAAEWPGLEGMDLAKEVSRLQVERWTGGKWAWGQGYEVNSPLPAREGSGWVRSAAPRGHEPRYPPLAPPWQGGE